MELDFEIIINTPEESVDMKSALDTFQGISDATRKVSQSFLDNEVVRRINFKSDSRTKLKQTFKGSFGQNFSLEVAGNLSQSKINDLGVKNFVGILNFFIMEARYGGSRELSTKSKNFLESVKFSENDLIDEIRSSCMKRIHKISKKFGHDVRFQYKSRDKEEILIAKFDQNSANLLDPVFDKRKYTIKAGVTRLNINTGNGRIQEIGERKTTAFGFYSEYSSVDLKLKKLFSENLDENNGVKPDSWEYMDLTVQRLRLKDGKTVKYMILDAK
ncbi:hypothetical protein [Xanthomonas arboricola]